MSAETPAALRETYINLVCWYCQGVGYVQLIPVKRRGRMLLGPSRVKCLVCDGDGKKRLWA